MSSLDSTIVESIADEIVRSASGLPQALTEDEDLVRCVGLSSRRLVRAFNSNGGIEVGVHELFLALIRAKHAAKEASASEDEYNDKLAKLDEAISELQKRPVPARVLSKPFPIAGTPCVYAAVSASRGGVLPYRLVPTSSEASSKSEDELGLMGPQPFDRCFVDPSTQVLLDFGPDVPTPPLSPKVERVSSVITTQASSPIGELELTGDGGSKHLALTPRDLWNEIRKRVSGETIDVLVEDGFIVTAIHETQDKEEARPDYITEITAENGEDLSKHIFTADIDYEWERLVRHAIREGQTRGIRALLQGPPGTGKSSSPLLFARTLVKLSREDPSVQTIERAWLYTLSAGKISPRGVIYEAESATSKIVEDWLDVPRRSGGREIALLYIDEADALLSLSHMAHGFEKREQLLLQSLLGDDRTPGCHLFLTINTGDGRDLPEPIRNRCTVIDYKEPSHEQVEKLIQRDVNDALVKASGLSREALAGVLTDIIYGRTALAHVYHYSGLVREIRGSDLKSVVAPRKVIGMVADLNDETDDGQFTTLADISARLKYRMRAESIAIKKENVFERTFLRPIPHDAVESAMPAEVAE
jgi:hypothetical protein